MKLTLERNPTADGATLGKLYLDEAFFCYTLEDTDRHLETDPMGKIPCQTAIPRGVYRVIVDHSAHFNCELPHVLDVPGYEGVRIHPGNAPKDTEGCILVGSSIVNSAFISNSRATFNLLMQRFDHAYDLGEEIVLVVS